MYIDDPALLLLNRAKLVVDRSELLFDPRLRFPGIFFVKIDVHSKFRRIEQDVPHHGKHASLRQRAFDLWVMTALDLGLLRVQTPAKAPIALVGQLVNYAGCPPLRVLRTHRRVAYTLLRHEPQRTKDTRKNNRYVFPVRGLIV